jgi:transcription antitermination factor NusG
MHSKPNVPVLQEAANPMAVAWYPLQTALLSVVERLPGMVRFVTDDNRYVSVTDAEMTNVHEPAATDAGYESGSLAAVAERARIRGRCLEGIEEVLAGENRGEIVISVSSIRRTLKVMLGSYQVERLS